MLPQGQSHSPKFSVKEVAERLGITLSMLISLSTTFAELLSSEALQTFDRKFTSHDIMMIEQARSLVAQGLRYDQVISQLQTNYRRVHPGSDVVEEVDIEFLWGIPVASDRLPDPPGEDLPTEEPDPFEDITVDFPDARNSRWV